MKPGFVLLLYFVAFVQFSELLLLLSMPLAVTRALVLARYSDILAMSQLLKLVYFSLVLSLPY